MQRAAATVRRARTVFCLTSAPAFALNAAISVEPVVRSIIICASCAHDELGEKKSGRHAGAV